MENVLVTIWINPNDEIHFFQQLKIINDFSIEADYKWNTKDVKISKSMISYWLWVNIPLNTYIKFRASFIRNNGIFQ